MQQYRTEIFIYLFTFFLLQTIFFPIKYIHLQMFLAYVEIHLFI